jgi:hypothetical protein
LVRKEKQMPFRKDSGSFCPPTDSRCPEANRDNQSPEFMGPVLVTPVGRHTIGIAQIRHLLSPDLDRSAASTPDDDPFCRTLVTSVFALSFPLDCALFRSQRRHKRAPRVGRDLPHLPALLRSDSALENVVKLDSP